ncbi:3-oxoacyl-[acyl-carrier-protein] synthase III C-terminal domain-containing protein [Campylobacter taeniopygiae]|uniref:3-oxoacyl-[acyl-carrier-protein] synthase III C-terminal domain-containing protein n=1 Tax=Campylobacter taeniopygiae TaxID=2510188 RepID=UPI003D6C36F6
MKAIFKDVNISAISTTLPKDVKCIDEQIDKFYNGNQKQLNRIKKNIGINFRHISDQETTTLNLCYRSSLDIINNFSDIHLDALIFVTQTPDFLQPNNSHLLHGMLNLDQECLCFDINQGCSGYVYGLYVAFSLLHNGNCKNILLCVGDTISKIVDPKDSNTAPLFGDAGSATLLQKKQTNDNAYFILNSLGSGWNNIWLPNSAFKKTKDCSFLKMNGAEVFNFSIEKEMNSISNLLQFSNMEIENIDYLFFHQANLYIINNIARKLKLPLDKVPTASIAKYANTSSASIPLAICDLFQAKIKEHKKVILSGFGVGLSWASCCLSLNDTLIFKNIG